MSEEFTILVGDKIAAIRIIKGLASVGLTLKVVEGTQSSMRVDDAPTGFERLSADIAKDQQGPTPSAFGPDVEEEFHE